MSIMSTVQVYITMSGSQTQALIYVHQVISSTLPHKIIHKIFVFANHTCQTIHKISVFANQLNQGPASKNKNRDVESREERKAKENVAQKTERTYKSEIKFNPMEIKHEKQYLTFIKTPSATLKYLSSGDSGCPSALQTSNITFSHSLQGW